MGGDQSRQLSATPSPGAPRAPCTPEKGAAFPTQEAPRARPCPLGSRWWSWEGSRDPGALRQATRSCLAVDAPPLGAPRLLHPVLRVLSGIGVPEV